MTRRAPVAGRRRRLGDVGDDDTSDDDTSDDAGDGSSGDDDAGDSGDVGSSWSASDVLPALIPGASDFLGGASAVDDATDNQASTVYNVFANSTSEQRGDAYQEVWDDAKGAAADAVTPDWVSELADLLGLSKVALDVVIGTVIVGGVLVVGGVVVFAPELLAVGAANSVRKRAAR
jgi:hypothetical protein